MKNGTRVYLDGRPGIITDAFSDDEMCGYDVLLDDGTHKWVTHGSRRLESQLQRAQTYSAPNCRHGTRGTITMNSGDDNG